MGLPSALEAVTGGARHGAFTWPEALTAGYTEAKVRTLVARGKWVRLRVGAYAAGAVVQRARANGDRWNLLQAEAAALTINGAVVSHGSAVRWWRLAHLDTIGSSAQVACPRSICRKPWSDNHINVRPSELPASHVKELHGVRIASVERTVADIARDFGFLDGVVVGDSALAQRRTTRTGVEQVLLAMPRWPGVRRARDVVACLDARADNPLESLCHARWWQAGFPRPELQAWVFDETGFLGIVDGMWLGPFVAYEADGMVKYDRALGGPRTIHAEKLRQEQAENTGIVLRRYTWDEQRHREQQCVDRMAKGFEEAALRPEPRARIYVRDKDTPPPDPTMFFERGIPLEMLGLRLAYDGLRQAR